MGKDRDFEFEDVLPESWTDALQEFIGTLSSGLRLSKLNNTTVRAEAGEGTAQVGVGIGGLWRWRSANYDVAVSGGAGTKDIFVVAPTTNEFENNVDKTNRNWELRVVPTGETPSGVAAYRKVGEVVWSGTEITALAQLGPESVNGPQIRSGALSNNGDITWTREASGALVPQLKAGSVTGNEILDGTISTAKLATGAVTSPKFSPVFGVINCEGGEEEWNTVVVKQFMPGAIIKPEGATKLLCWIRGFWLEQGEKPMRAGVRVITTPEPEGASPSGNDFQTPDFNSAPHLGPGWRYATFFVVANVTGTGSTEREIRPTFQPQQVGGGSQWKVMGAHWSMMYLLVR